MPHEGSIALQRGQILVLGGYGGAGSSISRLLLQETDADVTIAGRNKAAAQDLCRRLALDYPGRVSIVFADASRADTLAEALRGKDLVISAATSVDYVDIVAGAALRAGVDYLDIHYPQKGLAKLKKMAGQIKAEGRCFITQAGFNPGLPSVLTLLGKGYLSRYEKARVGVAMNTRFEMGEALYEFMDSLADFGADVFRNGGWRKAGLRDVLTFDFGHQFGRKKCYPMNLEEMWALPEMLGLEEFGIYAAGQNWFLDYLVIPAALFLGRIRRGLGREVLSRLMVFGLESFSPQKEEVVLLLEAEGVCPAGPRKLRISVRHDDAYFITAAPVVACVRQYLDKMIKPGLGIMGHVVDPELLVKDLMRMGIEVEITLS
jgi:saccharopine dehydrogenase (NAD+, L-lysine-forming)